MTTTSTSTMMNLPQHPSTFDDAQMSLPQSTVGGGHAPVYPDLTQHHAPLNGSFLHYLDAPSTSSIAFRHDYSNDGLQQGTSGFHGASHLTFNPRSVSDLSPAGYTHLRQDIQHDNHRDDYTHMQRILSSGSGTAVVSSQHPQNAAQSSSTPIRISHPHGSLNQGQRHLHGAVPNFSASYDFSTNPEEQHHANSMVSTPHLSDNAMYNTPWPGMNIPLANPSSFHQHQQQQQQHNHSPTSSMTHHALNNNSSNSKTVSPHDSNINSNAFTSFEGSLDYNRFSNINGSSQLQLQPDSHHAPQPYGYQQHDDQGIQNQYQQQNWVTSSISPTSPLPQSSWQMNMGFDSSADNPNLGINVDLSGMNLNNLNMPMPMSIPMTPALGMDMDVTVGGIGIGVGMTISDELADNMDMNYPNLIPNMHWSPSEMYDAFNGVMVTGNVNTTGGMMENSTGADIQQQHFEVTEWVNETPTGGQTLNLPGTGAQSLQLHLPSHNQQREDRHYEPTADNLMSGPPQPQQGFMYQADYHPTSVAHNIYSNPYPQTEVPSADNNSTDSRREQANNPQLDAETSISPPPALVPADPQMQAQMHYAAAQRDSAGSSVSQSQGADVTVPSSDRIEENRNKKQSSPTTDKAPSHPQAHSVSWYDPQTNKLISDPSRKHANRDRQASSGNHRHHHHHHAIQRANSRQAPSLALTTTTAPDKDKGKGRDEAVRSKNVRAAKTLPSFLHRNDAVSAVSPQRQSISHTFDRHETISPVSPQSQSARVTSFNANLNAQSIGAHSQMVSPFEVSPSTPNLLSAGSVKTYHFPPSDLIVGSPTYDKKTYFSDDSNFNEIIQEIVVPTQNPSLARVGSRISGGDQHPMSWGNDKYHMLLNPDGKQSDSSPPTTGAPSRKGKERADPIIPVVSTSPTPADEASTSPIALEGDSGSGSGTGAAASKVKKTSNGGASGSGKSSGSGAGTSSGLAKKPKKVMTESDRPGPKLACLFCRNRKIACGPPPPGSADPTCNQCKRRSIECTYPAESRRGMRGNRRPKVQIINTNTNGIASSSSSAQTGSNQDKENQSSSPTRARGRRRSSDNRNSDTTTNQVEEQEDIPNSAVDNTAMDVDSSSPPPTSASHPQLNLNSTTSIAEGLQSSLLSPLTADPSMIPIYSEDSMSYVEVNFNPDVQPQPPSFSSFSSSSLSGSGWPSGDLPYANTYAGPSEIFNQHYSSDMPQGGPNPNVGANGRPLPSPFTTQPLIRPRPNDGHSNTDN